MQANQDPAEEINKNLYHSEWNVKQKAYELNSYFSNFLSGKDANQALDEDARYQQMQQQQAALEEPKSKDLWDIGSSKAACCCSKCDCASESGSCRRDK